MNETEEARDSVNSTNIMKTKAVTSKSDLSCDRILNEIGGFGPYQILIGIASGVAILLASIDIYSFVFASVIPEHRCWIPECESSDSRNFHANWTEYAIPLKDGVLDSCSRYAYISTDIKGLCGEQNFNRSQMIDCDGYIIKGGEERLVSHLNSFCTGRERSMPLIGTASTIGKASGILFAGIASDKLGRLKTFVGCLVLGSIFGCLQALPAPLMSFELYGVLEFLVAFVTAGVLGAACTYNMEWVTARYRAYVNCTSLLTDALHPTVIGIAAWYFESNFVAFKLGLSLLGFVMILMYFVLTESPQWLLARQRYSHLIKSISKAGKVNGRPPSLELIEQIQNEPLHAIEKVETDRRVDHGNQVTILTLFRQKVLVVRLIVLSFAWLSAVFAFYGIMLGSTKVHDNKYISFILIGLAAIPGALLPMVTLNRLGRRMTIGGSLLVMGAMLLLSTQLSADLEVIQLILFFISRAAVKISTVGLSTYTTELWPTVVRNRAFNICSFFGRIGGILGTLSVMLTRYYEQLPMIFYGSTAIVAAILLFAFLPETRHCEKLPDTIDEALAIGNKKKSVT